VTSHTNSAVIASEAKQSILSLRGAMDCFAPLAMTLWDHHSTFKQQMRVRHLAAWFARVLHERFPSKEEREQGMPGARCTRGLVCKFVRKNRTRAYRFSGNTPAFPAQWLYDLWRALPGDEFVLSPSSAD